MDIRSQRSVRVGEIAAKHQQQRSARTKAAISEGLVNFVAFEKAKSESRVKALINEGTTRLDTKA